MSRITEIQRSRLIDLIDVVSEANQAMQHYVTSSTDLDTEAEEYRTLSDRLDVAQSAADAYRAEISGR
jgi:hypothetical protein